MSELPVFSFARGDAPVLVTIPHAGTALMPGMAGRMTDTGAALPDTDWYMERLYAGAFALGIGVLRANYSRYVIDLNRGADDATLYPGRPKTGLVPELTFDGEPIYREGEAPDEAEIAARRLAYWQPYHDAVAEELARLKARWGWAVLWDGHSIRDEIPRLFEGRLPDLNFGTNEGASCDPSLMAPIMESVGKQVRYTHVLNGRFKGGYTTRHYGRPPEGLHAIQLEKAQNVYLDGQRAPWPISETKLRDMAGIVAGFLRQAKAWRP
ncbi:N-formylglutamate deformylase [Brytella acorum]|uniref:N-formylglutamate deformylase n=1 Tax=Brytella acorum TaxID=2959299 RepID=A0AA35UNI8_9PROT|nr:N-formylglutamate deformylase [Brytella acorum]MDF3625348.1 N-formylglutamate deformylase [Brytella acorum]CAI9119238.1 N-formylglutamate deformylase [Brytella acorum]